MRQAYHGGQTTDGVEEKRQRKRSANQAKHDDPHTDIHSRDPSRQQASTPIFFSHTTKRHTPHTCVRSSSSFPSVPRASLFASE